MRPGGRSHGSHGGGNASTGRGGNGDIHSGNSGSSPLTKEGLPLSSRSRGSLGKGGVGPSAGCCGDGNSRSGNSGSRRLAQGERGASGCSIRFRIATIVTAVFVRAVESAKGTTALTGEIATANEAIRICNPVVGTRCFEFIGKFPE